MSGFRSFNSKKLHSLILIFTFALTVVFNCKPSPKEKVQKVLAENNLQEVEKIRGVAWALFGDRLKEVEIVPVQDSIPAKYEVYLGFGGTSALTFLESEQYAARMKLELALQSYRFLQCLEGISFGKFRMSLIKPFFIKNGEERGTEEFEIFRFRADGDDLRKIPGFKETDSFAADRYDAPSPQVITILFKIVEKWHIELDQFARVEVN
ncbi:hypothetical protein LEP1GSC050_2982 [Leptospira broomii serovar Hurstbridge str. 5399]|uniref:Uncharacterized protein n=1 Tax=Leptospira broomii serovar Hurstbridge str. 5399 TaxID=1049789 RepID=T0GHP7_9LEPT|nr:hypothetical protein [Leptospira broomii]EQA44923.1 hypothetical protein LEP1GSC050_2982 [Leptospira broomii serovar Hurstbridge str. 5399]